MKSLCVVISLFIGVIHVANGQARNKWVLKLPVPFTHKLGILIQHGGPGVPVYDKSDVATAKIIDYLKRDTLFVPFGSDDYKYFTIAPPCDKFQPLGSYREYVINYNGRAAWVREIDLLRANRYNLGDYKIGGRVLHAAIMLPIPKADGNQCATVTTIMMYDEQYLYLIDATRLNNPALHWKNETFFSFVNPPTMPYPEPSTDADNNFVLTWENSEDGSKTKLTLGWTDNHIVAKSYETKRIAQPVAVNTNDEPKEEGPVAVTFPEAPGDNTVYTDEIHTAECSFGGVDAGDCGHISFSCGDFGDAITERLSAADQSLWNSVIQGSYPDRTFLMTYKIVPGRKCGAPDEKGEYYSDGPVQSVMTFKLKKK